MRIRQEQEPDYPEIYQMVQTAFATAKVKDGDEQDFVNTLRSGQDYIAELALIAEHRGAIVGHIMLTTTRVEGQNGNYTALLLAPLAVLLEHRNKGLGTQLVTKAMELARAQGFGAVFLAGDPQYYGRFGFVPVARFGLHCPPGIPEALHDCIMGCELTPGALHGVRGTVILGGHGQ